MFMFNARSAATNKISRYIAGKILFCVIVVKLCIGCLLVFGVMRSAIYRRYTGKLCTTKEGDFVRKDEIVLWACILVIAVLAFFGGMITMYGILILIWRI